MAPRLVPLFIARIFCGAVLITMTGATGSEPADSDGIDATKGLLRRLLGEQRAVQFELSLLHPSSCSGETRLCFGYSAGSGTGRVELSGTSGVELAMAANHYLKYTANISVSWENTGGIQAYIAPGPLPLPAAPVHVDRSTTYHYYANVCTFSYSFVWYTLDDWVREIDCTYASSHTPIPGLGIVAGVR